MWTRIPKWAYRSFETWKKTRNNDKGIYQCLIGRFLKVLSPSDCPPRHCKKYRLNLYSLWQKTIEIHYANSAMAKKWKERRAAGSPRYSVEIYTNFEKYVKIFFILNNHLNELFPNPVTH